MMEKVGSNQEKAGVLLSFRLRATGSGVCQKLPLASPGAVRECGRVLLLL